MAEMLVPDGRWSLFRFGTLSRPEARRVLSRLSMLGLFLLVALHLGDGAPRGGWGPATAAAQDESASDLLLGGGESSEEPPDSATEPTGAATEPSGGAASTAAPAPTANPAVSDGGQRTMLRTLMDAGWIGVLIFRLSMVAVGMIVEHSLTIRKGVLMPDPLIEQLDQLIEQGNLDDAMAICEEPANACLFSNVVLAGLHRYRSSEFGFAEYKAAVEEAGEDQTATLYRKTEVLGVIGSISPMLGLTGTVLGMIASFNTIAATGGMARPDQLAGGISQALVTTLMGLLVAIPCMVAFSYFRNRIDSIVAEAGKRVEQVLVPLGRRTRPAANV